MKKIINSLDAIEVALATFRKVEGATTNLRLETLEPLDNNAGWTIGLSRTDHQGFLDQRSYKYVVTVVQMQLDKDIFPLAVQSIKLEESK